MLVVLSLVVLLPLCNAQQCADSGLGPCIGGTCPDQFTCLNPGQANEVCCSNTQIVNPTTLPPPATVPTGAPPTVTVVTAITPAPGSCVDLVNPSTGVSDCTRMAAYCNNAQYYDLMTQQCPATCGRCTTSVTSGTCVDLLNPSTGVSDCPSRASLCSNSAYYDLMTQQCPRTCNRCSGSVTTIPSTCVDLLNPSTGVSDCPSRASLCNNASYYTLMTQQCPRTCNRCSGVVATTATTVTCVDLLNPSTGVSDCPSRAALCNNSAYYSLMTQQCPRTCGRCTSG